jgi:SAM-dependent methyltransferase
MLPQKIKYKLRELYKKNSSFIRKLGQKSLIKKIGNQWDASIHSLKIRKYNSYDDYITHQADKLKRVKILLDNYDIEYRQILRKRLSEKGYSFKGKNVLCLAARLGTEVKSFLDLGAFAVGIDINPGKKNKYVLFGDFHHLQFPPNSADLIFTNSIDHVYDIEQFLSEIKKVIKDKGFFISEIMLGYEDEHGKPMDFYGSLHWKKVDDLINYISESGLKPVYQQKFSYPWHGKHIWFTPASKN